MTIRLTEKKDIPLLSGIWKTVFNDNDSFISYYFSERFYPELSVCAEKNGRIISACFIYPCSVNIRGKAFKCGILNGVCTLPEYRGKGIMKQCMAYLHSVLYENGFFAAISTPVSFDIYKSLSYAPICDYIEPDMKSIAENNDMDFVITDIDEGSAKMLCEIYESAAGKLSGTVIRNAEQMSMRLSDWKTDNAKIITDFNAGYAVFSEYDDRLLCHEILAKSKSKYYSLLGALKRINGNIDAKLPVSSGISGKRHKKANACIINPQMFFDSFELNFDCTLEIIDNFNKFASGFFYLGHIKEASDITISASRFTECVFGYSSLRKSECEIHNRIIYEKLCEKLDLCESYNTDEY